MKPAVRVSKTERLQFVAISQDRQDVKVVIDRHAAQGPTTVDLERLDHRLSAPLRIMIPLRVFNRIDRRTGQVQDAVSHSAFFHIHQVQDDVPLIQTLRPRDHCRFDPRQTLTERRFGGQPFLTAKPQKRRSGLYRRDLAQVDQLAGDRAHPGADSCIVAHKPPADWANAWSLHAPGEPRRRRGSR